MFNKDFFHVGVGVIYPFHRLICFLKVGNIILSNSIINIPASIRPNGELIATRSVCV